VWKRGERRGERCYGVLLGKAEGKRLLGRHRCRWEDNIMMDLQEDGCEIKDWIELDRDRDGLQGLVNAVKTQQTHPQYSMDCSSIEHLS
jgi:hypothetical protein